MCNEQIRMRDVEFRVILLFKVQEEGKIVKDYLKIWKENQEEVLLQKIRIGGSDYIKEKGLRQSKVVEERFFLRLVL